MQLRRLTYVFIVSLALLGFLNPASSWADTLGVNLSGPLEGQVAKGELFTFKAAAYGGSSDDYEYEWWVKYPDENWVNESGGYSPNNTFSITFDQEGRYEVSVCARNTGDTTNIEKSLRYTAIVPKTLEVSISASPSSPQNKGTPVTFTASVRNNLPNRTYESQWWVTPPSGFNLCEQDWSTSNSWTMTGNFENENGPGDYIIQVYVKDTTVATWQAQDNMTYKITSNATVTNLVPDPSTVTINKGANQALTIIADYSDKTNSDVTSRATYQSSNSNIATCNSSGVITAVNNGSATITASFGGKSVQIPVTVENTAGTVTSVIITPDKTHTYAGQPITFTAVASGTSGTVLYRFLTNKYLKEGYVEQQGWSLSNTFVFNGEVANYGVKVEAKDAISGAEPVSAKTDVSFLSTSPASISFSKGSPQPVNTEIDITAGKSIGTSDLVYSIWACPPGEEWRQIKPYNSFKTISFTGDTPGTYQFEAYCKDINDGGSGGTYRSGIVGYVFEVASGPEPTPVLESIRVVPSDVIIVGKNTYYSDNPLVVQAKYSDSSNYVTISDTISWSSNNSNIATVESGNRLKSGNIYGTTQVTASYKGKTATCTVTVTEATPILESIQIVPSSATIVGKNTYYSSNPLVVQAKYSNSSNYVTISDTISWSSNNSNIATVESGNRLKSGSSTGTTTLTASHGGKTAPCTVTVTDSGSGGFILNLSAVPTYITPGKSTGLTLKSNIDLNNTPQVMILINKTTGGYLDSAVSGTTITFTDYPNTTTTYVGYVNTTPTTYSNEVTVTVSDNSNPDPIIIPPVSGTCPAYIQHSGIPAQYVKPSYNVNHFFGNLPSHSPAQVLMNTNPPAAQSRASLIGGGNGVDSFSFPPIPSTPPSESYVIYEGLSPASTTITRNNQEVGISYNIRTVTRTYSWDISQTSSTYEVKDYFVPGTTCDPDDKDCTPTEGYWVYKTVHDYSYTYTFIVNEQNMGNPQSCTWVSPSNKIDTRAPEVPSVSSSANQQWTNASSVNVNFQSSDYAGPEGGIPSGVKRIMVEATGGHPVNTSLSGSNGTVVISREGTTRIKGRAEDGLSPHSNPNLSAWSSEHMVKIDRTKPSTPSFSSAPNQGWSNANSVIVTITANDINPGVNEISGTRIIEVKATGATNNNWTLYGPSGTITISEEGTTDIVARATDIAGNVTDWSGVYKVRIDRTPPTIVGFFTKGKGASVTMPNPNPNGGDGTTPGYNAGKFAGYLGGFNIGDINNRIFYRYSNDEDIVFKIKAIDPNTKNNQSGLRNLQATLTKTDEGGIGPVIKNSAAGELTFTKDDLARAAYNGGIGNYTMTVKAWDNPIHGTTRCNNHNGADCTGSYNPYNCTALKFNFTVANLDLIGLTSVLTAPTTRTINLKGGPYNNIKTPGNSSHPVNYPQSHLKLTEENPNWAVYNNKDDKIRAGTDITKIGTDITYEINGTVQLQYRVPLPGAVTLRGRTQATGESVTPYIGNTATYSAKVYAESLNPVQITVRPVSGLITNLTPYNASSPNDPGKVYTINFYTTNTPLQDETGEPGSGIGVPEWGVPED